MLASLLVASIERTVCTVPMSASCSTDCSRAISARASASAASASSARASIRSASSAMAAPRSSASAAAICDAFSCVCRDISAS
eukprot:2169681-Prymnesium_polylepis.1